MSDQRVYISSPIVRAYLEQLAQTGVYGSRAGAVATFILRKEIMRLIETGVLNQIKFLAGKGSDEEDTDSE